MKLPALVTAADISPAVIDAALDVMFHRSKGAWRKAVLAESMRADMRRALVKAYRTAQRERADDVPQ